MCEGELLQVVGRTDFPPSEQRCLSIIERKTAALFGAGCRAGVMVAGGEPHMQQALRQFGVCLGMAFQILDDCRDLLCNEEHLGKKPGQDLAAGDATLPLLYGAKGSLLCRGQLRSWAGHSAAPGELASVCDAFRSSQAFVRVRQLAGAYIHQARTQLGALRTSDFKASLQGLTGHIAASLSDILRR